MKKVVLITGFILFFLTHNLSAEEAKINLVPVIPTSIPFITSDNMGNFYILYYGNDQSLYVIKNKGSEVYKLGKEGTTGSFIWMGFPGGIPSVIWRPKVSDSGYKYIYFQRAEGEKMKFGQETVLNNQNDALLPINVAWKDKKIYVSWPDERPKPVTNIYMNVSVDGGKTFMEKDVNLTPDYAASTHQIVIDERKLYFFFLGRKQDEENSGIYVRTSDDGMQWSEIATITTLENWTPFKTEAVMTPEGPVLFWAGFQGIWYAYPDDKGGWQVRMIEQTKDMQVNKIEIRKGRTGQLYIISSYKEKEQRERKPSVYFFASNNNGKTWSEPVKVNHNKYDNTSSLHPDMHVLENGTIIVIWQDHRLIRGNIYMNYSKDGGKTWLSEDININDKPGENNDFYPFIAGYKNTAYILIPRYKDDSLRGEYDIYLEEVTLGN